MSGGRIPELITAALQRVARLFRRQPGGPAHLRTGLKAQVHSGGRGKAGGIKVASSPEEGEAIARPLKDNSQLKFHPMAAFFWAMFIVGPIGLLMYLLRMNARVIDDMVVNMIDVGEETGELDTMLYKVADNYDEEVSVLTESLMSLMEPLLIIVLGGMVGFIVIALFMPLIALIQKLSK